MNVNNIETRILVKNRPINEYTHEGDVFIEGRGGSSYEIEVKNLTGLRVEAVLSVDGLSVTDGKPANALSRGYVLGPHETMRIPGWKLSNEQVAAFQFADKKASYAGQSQGGDTRNTGVIGVMTFKERPVSTSYVPMHGIMRGMSDNYGAGGYVNTSSSSRRIQSPGVNVSEIDNSYLAPTLSGGLAASSVSSTESLSKSAAAPEIKAQNLGTEFGAAKEFATTSTTFTRADMLSMATIYYDDARGLRARGIELDRRKKEPRIKPKPQAFQGVSCTPPAGWKG